MQATNRIRLLVAAVTAGWVGVFAEAAGLTPWRPHLAVHIALVGLLIAGTVIAAVAVLLRGPLLYQMIQLGRATEVENRRVRAGVAG